MKQHTSWTSNSFRMCVRFVSLKPATSVSQSGLRRTTHRLLSNTLCTATIWAVMGLVPWFEVMFPFLTQCSGRLMWVAGAALKQIRLTHKSYVKSTKISSFGTHAHPHDGGHGHGGGLWGCCLVDHCRSSLEHELGRSRVAAGGDWRWWIRAAGRVHCTDFTSRVLDLSVHAGDA
jgi:hypothetical protein